MTELLTAAQMRAIEQAAIELGEVTGLELMERAGQGVVEAIFEEWPELDTPGKRAVVLCGPGNNGGDGFVVARLLKARGWEVEVFLYGDPAKLPPDAKMNYERWLELGEVQELDARLEPSMRKPAVIIDALFGTGLTRPITDLGRLLLDLHDCRDAGEGVELEMRQGVWPYTVLIDLPSGLCSDSGRVLWPDGYVGPPENLQAASATAELTVTFHAAKLGHYMEFGPELCGKVVVKDIGIEKVC